MNRGALPGWAWLTLLMLVVCLPRVTIDAYLPSLPKMADSLNGTDAQLQLTLTMYMVGYALSMLASGPLSDRYGRRPVLIAGLMMYICATLACVLSTNVPEIVTARAFQALGGCAGTVIGRVIVRERFPNGHQATMLSRISAGMALSPVIAPIAGSVIDQWLGWRGVFAVLGLAGVATAFMVCRYLPETLEPAGPGESRYSLSNAYWQLLTNRGFLRYSLAISFVYCTYFPFVAESSTLFQRNMHVSGSIYAVIFGVTVLGYLIGSSIFRRSSQRWAVDAIISGAAAVNLLGATLLWGLTSMVPVSVWSIMVPMFIVMLSVGIAIPACQFAVLQPFAKIAGAASGLFFFIQMSVAAFCGGMLSWLQDGSSSPMIPVTFFASAAFMAVFLLLRQRGSVRGNHAVSRL